MRLEVVADGSAQRLEGVAAGGISGLLFGDYVRLAATAFVTGSFNNRTVKHLFAGAGPGVRYDTSPRCRSTRTRCSDAAATTTGTAERAT